MGVQFSRERSTREPALNFSSEESECCYGIIKFLSMHGLMTYIEEYSARVKTQYLRPIESLSCASAIMEQLCLPIFKSLDPIKLR